MTGPQNQSVDSVYIIMAVVVDPTASFPQHTPKPQLFKFTILLRPHADFLVDRFSERCVFVVFVDGVVVG